MDPVTAKVRQMYELFPYPSRAARTMGDCHPQLCLSYREGYEPRDSLHILDAGCGTGACSLGTAFCNPMSRVTGIDVNRTALNNLRAEAEQWQLENLTVQEVDLNTLEGLKVPEGGFDVVVCSGVLHHLAEQETSLQNLVGVLAPHGVMRLMVYNTLGRQAIYRFAEALNVVHPRREELKERLQLGRRLMEALSGGPTLAEPWQDGPLTDDVEFVDRYLNLHDVSYSVAEYFALLESAGLTFLRWYEPRDWTLERYLESPSLVRDLGDLSELDRYRLVEQISNQTQLDALLAHNGSQLRTIPGDLRTVMVSASPQVWYEVRHEPLGPSFFESMPRASLREAPPEPLQRFEYELLKRLSQGPAPALDLITSDEDEQGLRSMLERELLCWSPL